jgi:hypothetical protein
MPVWDLPVRKLEGEELANAVANLRRPKTGSDWRKPPRLREPTVFDTAQAHGRRRENPLHQVDDEGSVISFQEDYEM